MSDKSETPTATFETAEQITAWAGIGGNHAMMPVPGSPKWELHIRGAKGDETKVDDNGKMNGVRPVTLESPFGDIVAFPPYGGFKWVGKHYPFGKYSCSGMIEFGFSSSGEPVRTNRRHISAEDNLADGMIIIDTIIDQPDRVIETIAVVVAQNDLKPWQKVKAEAWLGLHDTLRDGAEVYAAHTLRRYFTKSD